MFVVPRTRVARIQVYFVSYQTRHTTPSVFAMEMDTSTEPHIDEPHNIDEPHIDATD